jgi:hypothetical protein
VWRCRWSATPHGVLARVDDSSAAAEARVHRAGRTGAAACGAVGRLTVVWRFVAHGGHAIASSVFEACKEYDPWFDRVA